VRRLHGNDLRLESHHDSRQVEHSFQRHTIVCDIAAFNYAVDRPEVFAKPHRWRVSISYARNGGIRVSERVSYTRWNGGAFSPRQCFPSTIDENVQPALDNIVGLGRARMHVHGRSAGMRRKLPLHLESFAIRIIARSQDMENRTDRTEVEAVARVNVHSQRTPEFGVATL